MKKSVALTIAGSDSGGGAGIQADLRTFAALDVFGLSAITALTAQNPFEVRGIHPVPAAMVRLQIETVRSAFTIGAAKTGMLFDAEIITAVADALGTLRPPLPLVVDPVAISTSGAKLLKDDAIKALVKKIFPLAAWITPNVSEAELFTEQRITSIADAAQAATEMSRTWACGCVVKGGHLEDDEAVDVVAFQNKLFTLSSPRVELSEPAVAHGTGCTFSAALAASLAKGMTWKKALIAAKSFVLASLAGAVTVGPKTRAMFPPKAPSVPHKISFQSFSGKPGKR